MSKVSKVVRWAILTLVILFVAFFYGYVPWFLTNLATTSRYHFDDPNDGRTPQSYGTSYQDVEFRSSDGIPLKGWYVPAGPHAKGTIVYANGLYRTRLEMLPMAAFAHGLGYNGLLFDLRHQGESGGKITTLGYRERLDVEAAVHYALTEEHAARPVVLWGVSMGAAAALMAAADSPEVSAVISDSTFLTLPDVIWHHYYLLLHILRRRWWWFPPLPAFPLTDEVTHWIAWRAHFKPSDFDLRKAVKRINPPPILFVAVQGDERMPPAIARTLYGLSTSPLKAIVVVPGKRPRDR